MELELPTLGNPVEGSCNGIDKSKTRVSGKHSQVIISHKAMLVLSRNEVTDLPLLGESDYGLKSLGLQVRLPQNIQR